MIFIILESIPDIEPIRDPLCDFILNCALCALCAMLALMINPIFDVMTSTRFTNRNKNNPKSFQ